MKKIIIFLIVFSASILSQDKYYTFSELKGMEDNEGNTHLFYRMFDSIGSFSGSSYKEENSIYHLDLFNNKDTLFLFDGGRFNTLIDPEFFRIIDYEFFNKNPEEFIYSGVSTIVDPVPYIKRFDEDESSYSFLGEERNGNIEISKQNDSLLFASIAGDFLRSTTGGRNWETISSLYGKFLISVSPFNDSIIFFQEGNNLYKSINRGDNLSKTDTFYTDFHSFFYDKDGINIYRLIKDNNSYHLSVSNNKGEAYSWQKKYSSEKPIFISIDTSQSGHIYLADGKYIYHSTDYGETFNLFKELEKKIVGIYKKPGSDKLYAATKYDLYEITTSAIQSLKHLPLDPDLFEWYPLEIGNKWIYKVLVLEVNTSMLWGYNIYEVVADTIINAKHYFKTEIEYVRKDTNSKDYTYFRVDSLNGKIFRLDSGAERLIEELAAEIGDTVFMFENSPYSILFSEEEISLFGLNTSQRFFSEIGLCTCYHVLLKGVGLYHEYWQEFSGYEYELKGFVKNGIVYGDTSRVLVSADDGNNLPTEFSLSQNFPNPFNPSTKIKYAVPQTSSPLSGGARGGLVTLRIYDILGNEIATLVNEEKSPGEYEVEFDASKYNLSSGIYFYQLKCGSFIQTNKMILLK